MVSSCGSWDLVAREARGDGVAALFQDRYLAGVVHDCQFVGKAFFLSHRNNALFVFFFRLIYYLNGLPKGYMPQISRSKDTVQKA
jgi:hypothetical protein